MIVSYLTQLYGPVKTISKNVAGLQKQLASAERAFDLLDEVPHIDEKPDAIAIERARGAIELRGVSFAYDGVNDVFRDVSFEVEPGERIGIVGKTGAGKTTLVSLLTRFYAPDSGTIELDGHDLSDYKLADLRNQFSIVLQEPVLFSTSIAENIAYARPEATEEEIVAAAKAAGAHDFIVRMEDGYDAVVGERGNRLSGGERQRISLARAFLKDAPILVLDEPTSSMDNASEARFRARLAQIITNKTLILITHRSSMLQLVDRLIVLDGGKVVADGPKAQVLNSLMQGEIRVAKEG
jgi:ATP-binding cassette subfamily B protein